ncbi:putative transporter [compost metagenome]
MSRHQPKEEESQHVSSGMYRLYALTFLFFSVNAFTQVVLPLHGKSIGLDNRTIGVLLGAYLLVSMLLRPWAGAVVERVGARRMLQWILLSHLLVLLLYAWLDQTASGLILIRGLQGAIAAFFSLTLQIAVVDALPERERAQGLSLYLLFGMLPSVMGPAVALWVWEHAGFHGFMMTLLLVAVITWLTGLASRLPVGSRSHSLPPPRYGNELASGPKTHAPLRRAIGNRSFIMSSVVMTIAATGFGATTAFLALYVKHTQVGHAGIYFAIQSGVIVLVRFAFRKLLPSDGIWHSRTIAVLLGSMTIGLLFTVMAPWTGQSMVLYMGAATIGFGMAHIYPLLAAYLSIALEQTTRKIWMGLFISMADLGAVIGSIGMGVVADYIGYSYVFGICAGMLACTGLLVAVSGSFMKK